MTIRLRISSKVPHGIVVVKMKISFKSFKILPVTKATRAGACQNIIFFNNNRAENCSIFSLENRKLNFLCCCINKLLLHYLGAKFHLIPCKIYLHDIKIKFRVFSLKLRLCLFPGDPAKYKSFPPLSITTTIKLQ